MNKIVEFHLECGSRNSVTFIVDDEDKLILNMRKSHSNKLATTYVAPQREIDVLAELLPEDVEIVIHETQDTILWDQSNRIESYTDNVLPAEKLEDRKAISILVFDGFSLQKAYMNQLEREVKNLRIFYARKNLAVTLHHAYPINSANYQAYKNENFTLFEAHRIPVPVSDIMRFDLVLTTEHLAKLYQEDALFFQNLLEYLQDTKKAS